MADKAAKELERIYTIPLRLVKTSPRNHRADRAVRAVKKYLSKHMKAQDVWIDMAVNEKLWDRGMYQIPSRIRVRALKFDDGVVEVTLPEADVTSSIRAKIAEQREKQADEKEKKAEKKEKDEEKAEKKGEEKAAGEGGENPTAPEGEKKEKPEAEKQAKGAPSAEKKESHAKSEKPAHKAAGHKESPKSGPSKKD